jgi:hypothetical protein
MPKLPGARQKAAQEPWQTDVDATIRECLRAIRVRAGESADGDQRDAPKGSDVGVSTMADVVLKLAEAQAMGTLGGGGGGDD